MASDTQKPSPVQPSDVIYVDFRAKKRIKTLGEAVEASKCKTCGSYALDGETCFRCYDEVIESHGGLFALIFGPEPPKAG